MNIHAPVLKYLCTLLINVTENAAKRPDISLPILTSKSFAKQKVISKCPVPQNSRETSVCRAPVPNGHICSPSLLHLPEVLFLKRRRGESPFTSYAFPRNGTGDDALPSSPPFPMVNSSARHKGLVPFSGLDCAATPSQTEQPRPSHSLPPPPRGLTREKLSHTPSKPPSHPSAELPPTMHHFSPPAVPKLRVHESGAEGSSSRAQTPRLARYKGKTSSAPPRGPGELLTGRGGKPRSCCAGAGSVPPPPGGLTGLRGGARRGGAPGRQRHLLPAASGRALDAPSSPPARGALLCPEKAEPSSLARSQPRLLAPSAAPWEAASSPGCPFSLSLSPPCPQQRRLPSVCARARL